MLGFRFNDSCSMTRNGCIKNTAGIPIEFSFTMKTMTSGKQVMTTMNYGLHGIWEKLFIEMQKGATAKYDPFLLSSPMHEMHSRYLHIANLLVIARFFL